MSSSARFVSLLLLTLLSVAIPLRAQSTAKTAAKTARGIVSGRVTIKNKPAPGIVVGLRKTIGSAPILEPFQKATTDQEGNYRITNVTPGTYDVIPAALAYVVADGNNLRGKNVVVGEDEEVEDINFSLVRGGVITGKVTDADGRPVIQQQVYLYRTTDFSQQPPRQVFPANSTQTDDRGIYRFFGLVAGQYKVSAGRGDGMFAGAFNSGRLIYKQVFHPDASDQAKATVIDVREGSEAANVDIALGSAVQTFSASGRIIYGDTQLPAPNFRFGLQRFSGQRFEAPENLAVSNAQGDFVVDGLTPGRYGIFLYPNQNPELRPESITFDVVDQDVSMITIKLLKGLTVSGVVVFEHEDKKAFAKLLELQLRGQMSSPETSTAMVQTASTPISPDGSFRLIGLSPGLLSLWLSTPTPGSPAKGFFISRIEQNGLVVSQVQIKEGDHLMGVRVFVGYGSASLRGVVNVDRGLMPEGARMFARLVKPGAQMNTIATSMVDARGHFLMEGIPAGVYEISVSLFVPAGTRVQPNTVTQQVTVQDGVVSDVSLTLELPQPKP
jgi:protocatechuate 3,4-dioxygenase beta subunit